MLSTAFKSFIAILSLITALGVFVHDGRVDKAVATAAGVGISGLALYATGVSLQAKFADFVATDAHTHPDHGAANSLLHHAFSYKQPSVAPRRNSHHKQLKSLLAGGRHAFDNTNLPLLDY